MNIMKAEIFNWHGWTVETNSKILKESIGISLVAAGFQVLGYMEHNFKPQGFTGLWLLAESHCAIHTFPEENRAYIEISSCNHTMFDQFLTLIEMALFPKHG